MSRRNKKRIALLKAEWGKPKKETFNYNLIEEYFSLKPSGASPYQLKDRAVEDLDFFNFFEFIDRTNSAIGQQYLFYKLRQLNNTPANLQRLEERVQHYNKEEEKRLDLQLALININQKFDYYLPFIIYGQLPEKMKHLWVIRLLQLLFFAGILATFINTAFLLPLILIFGINSFIHFRAKGEIGFFTSVFSRLGAVTQITKKILPEAGLSSSEEAVYRANIKGLEKIVNKINVLRTDRLQDNEITAFVWYAFELLKIVTLSDIITFNSVIDEIKAARTQLDDFFLLIGELDVALSIASLRVGLPHYCTPTFIAPQKEFELKSLYHPLLKECVANDLHLQGHSLLLTGSNMSGKSTFIKAINLNIIAAQALNTSFSQYCRIPFFGLATSIRIGDDLMMDKSYYMEEVNAIGSLIELSEQQNIQLLFTIDEVFKGTNTIERVSAAKAILEYLNRGNHIVLVSTHDIELTQLLTQAYDLYYFQERIENETLSFDYQLRKGALEKKNAIKILEIAGYPTSIITEAKRLAEELEKEKTQSRLE